MHLSGSGSWRRLAGLAVLPAAAAALAGCGSGGSSASSAGAKATAPGPATAAGQQVTATEREYSIHLSTMRLRPGPATFVAVNKGQIAHSLEIDGPGVPGRRITGTIAPGETEQLAVTLRNGTYEISCPVDGHRVAGMDVRVTVGSSTTTGGQSTGTTTTGGGYGGFGY